MDQEFNLTNGFFSSDKREYISSVQEVVLSDMKNWIVCLLTEISTPDGTTTGRNDSECGHIGHINIDGVLGWTTDAPAASA